MDQQNPTIAKIIILDTGKFEQCQFWIQQYLQHEHYALWEVIEFGDSYEAPAENPTTELWAAILKTFGDNEATKKTKKNLLKQQYGNFKAEGSETLDQTFNRLQVIVSQPQFMDVEIEQDDLNQKFQVIVSQLQFMDVEVKKDDLNQKFLTSLAPEWLMHTIVWRNGNDLDTKSLDDLYNHLKVYEAEVQTNKYKTTQELWAAILKTFSGNEATKKTEKNLLKQQYGNFKAEGSKTLEQTFNRLQVIVSQLQFMDVEIEQDNLNQKFLTSLAPEWLVHTIVWRNESDLDTMSLDDLYNHLKTGKKISIQRTDVAGFDKSKVECFNCHKMGHFVRECRAPRSQDRGRRDNYIQGSKVEEQTLKALMAIDGVGWDWIYMANDKENHALVTDEEAPTEFALMAKTSAESEVFDSSLCSKARKKNTDSLNSKITDLTAKLFDAKNMIYHYKLGLAQVEARLAEHRSQELKYCEKIRVLEFKTESRANCIKSLTKDLELLMKEKDKNKKGLGYSDVPPPPAQIYSPLKKDMSWTGLPEFKDDTVTDYSRPSPAIESTSNDAQNRNPSVTETEASPSTISPKSFIKFVKANDSPTKSKTNKVETAKKPPVKHMTCNISYLFDYEPFDGGYVSFGQGGCKITGKGTIKTGKLEFENVYFMKDLKYNLFNVSQICDNKNSVLFTDSECIVLGQNFKLSDDDNVLLRTPRQHNMYSIDLNNIVSHKDLTCLVAKASADECMLWHMRLGHLNFKTMNRLVRHNLVRGLPSKCFENDHTCTACLKGKQHKAS
nr:ribonuclease H-like domain-containing protein [Tanacetum cinerariifolium]